jgi:hypothetical protein
MNNLRWKAGTYLGLCAALFSSSYLINGIGAITFISLASICFAIMLIFLAASKWNTPWLITMAEHVNKVKVWHLVVFFAFYRIGLVSMQNGRVWLGITSIYVGYTILAYVTGTLIGEFLRSLFDRTNLFQPSVDIPKEYKDKGWGL